MKTSWMAACLLIGVIAAPSAFGETTLPTFTAHRYEVAQVAHQADLYDDGYGEISLPSPVSQFDGCCAGGGCTGCTTCGGYCGGCSDRLPWLPIFRHSDPCFDGFISPMTNPVFFEDPRNLTEVRFIALNNQLPPALGSGDVQVYAPAMRFSVTERMSLIVTKGGYVVGGADAPHGDGWADLSAGLKYLLFADPQSQRLLSTGFTFELPVGSQRAFQGNGDGELNVFLTGGMQIGYNWHWLSCGGVRMPMNTLQEAPVMYWSNHIDRRLLGGWYVFTEYNWYNYLKDGRTAFNGINGIDLYNLGGRNIAGNNIVTGAFGTKWKPARWTELGVAWELPLSVRKDVMEHRLTADWIIRF